MNTQTQTETLMRLTDVIAMTSMSRALVYAKMQRGEFPRPVKLGVQARAWRRSEVVAWIEAREAA